MTDNMKRFIEKVSQDADLLAKVKDMDKAELIAEARRQGIELADADVAAESNAELSEDELSAVAGGGNCTCVAGGGGTAGDKNNPCGCVAIGIGKGLGGKFRCDCYLYGTGED